MRYRFQVPGFKFLVLLIPVVPEKIVKKSKVIMSLFMATGYYKISGCKWLIATVYYQISG
jgi:hypothetical protein